MVVDCLLVANEIIIDENTEPRKPSRYAELKILGIVELETHITLSAFHAE